MGRAASAIWLRDGLGSLALALVLVLACRQITLDGAYAPHPMYRAQVEALLDGRLALNAAPDGLLHDLAWTPTGVQQVWGLGVPLWQLPFEAAGRLVGVSPFPDRIPLVGWLAVALFAVVRAFRPRDVGELRPDDQRSDAGRTRATDSRAMQIGAVLLTALLPGLLSVLRGRMGVYEEAAIYAYGAAVILLGGLVSVRRRPTTARYLLLLAFAGLTGLFRPTVWFYGLATALVASVVLLRARGAPAVRVIAIGLALFVAGGGALYASNAHRFGRGTEFGHRLNVHSLPGNIVATRFSYPFERAGTVEAATELVASLFDGPERRSKRGFYQTGLHRGQSVLPRWREYYFTTFSWPYLPVLAAGLVLAALAWRRRGDPFARMLGAWAVLGGLPLFAFYLHAPSVSSRYQLDLAPAIAALLVLAWRACVTRWPRVSLVCMVALWAGAVVTGKTTRPRGVSDPVGREVAASTASMITHAVALDHELPAAYELGDPLLPMRLDALEDFARCTDQLGAAIPCNVAPLPGDEAVIGHRIGRWWRIDHYAIPEEPEPVCFAPEPVRRDARDDARGHVRDDVSDDARDDEPGVCSTAPTVPLDPSATRTTQALPPALYLNGFGWDLGTLRVPPATFFYVDDPDYIALDVIGPPETDWQHAVRVAVGLEHLRLVAVAETTRGAQLRFAGGRHPGVQVAFVAFGSDMDLDRAQSQLGLRSIRWRD
jgi:hypothetical protein